MFIIGWTLQDLTRRGFDPMRYQVSQLALGDNGWQQAVNFILSGALLVAFGIGLRRKSRLERLAPALMITAGLAFAVAAFIPTAANGYPPGAESSPNAINGIHDLAATVWFLSMLIAGIATGLGFLKQGKHSLGIYSITSVVAMLIFVSISSIGMARVPGFVDVGGLFERLSLMSALIWVTVLAIAGWPARDPLMFSDSDWEVRSIVEASPDDVFQVVVVSRQDEMRALGSGYQHAVEVDGGNRTVTVRGHWWYHGTHRIDAHPEGSEVTYRVRNKGGLLSLIDKPNYRKTMRRDLDRLLNDISRQLGCSFRDN